MARGVGPSRHPGGPAGIFMGKLESEHGRKNSRPAAHRRLAPALGSLCALFAVVALAAPPLPESPPPLELEYKLRLVRPTSHLVEVEIAAGNVTAPELDFVMPAWAPGRYAIYDFAKNVQEFEASGNRGQMLPWTKLDKQTWRVNARQAGGKVHVNYRVFANDLSGSFSQFDSSHASLNSASVFMFVSGHLSDPLTLRVEAPDSWKLVSGFSLATDQRAFRVSNYDLLVDTPVEISADCSVDEFREAGKTFRVAIHSFGERDAEPATLVDGLRKIVRSEMAMMPSPDFEHYTFIVHFAPDVPLGDGMEHFNSTDIVIRGSPADGLVEALETAAHEFFHLWNVKRLRPQSLGPFDYTHETYTRSLWFAEGVTSYYAYVHLLRAGLWSRQEFLKRLAEEIRQFESEPGRKLMSAESSSFNAWFYDRSPQMQETNFANATISYYNKGLLLGMLLDLEIRSRTGGRTSLDDVMRAMVQKFYEGGNSSYYARGRTYEEKDILETGNEVSGGDFASFFEKYVEGTDPLPYAPTLAAAGLELRATVPPGAAPSLGALTQREARGLKIVAIRPGSGADRGGLSRDDVLTAADDLSLATAALDERLKIYPAGAQVPFTVIRHGKEERITVALDPPPNSYSIEELPRATPEQVKIRGLWLGK